MRWRARSRPSPRATPAHTPVLPVTVPGFTAEPGRALTAADAHRVLLHCALDAAGIRLTEADRQAVADIAALDFRAVNSVIGWLAATPLRG
ncbi:hypothetical protein [Streptomyces zhihengii]|uniref:Uncharacterized protein n=1 Tax=Streptomyces zhihengii TaxID=1818004 RepID=A0ABS2UIR4_9ACTN|nr:hypothetical protein [Streptomyces zhihengii]MBM9617469.1 hypothetical protein [Streptomyces zhihengii]